MGPHSEISHACLVHGAPCQCVSGRAGRSLICTGEVLWETRWFYRCWFGWVGIMALGPLFIATTEATPPPFWSSNFSTLPDAYRARGHVEVSSSALWLFLASGRHKKTYDNRAIMASNSQAYRILGLLLSHVSEVTQPLEGSR